MTNGIISTKKNIKLFGNQTIYIQQTIPYKYTFSKMLSMALKNKRVKPMWSNIYCISSILRSTYKYWPNDGSAGLCEERLVNFPDIHYTG